MSGDRCCANAFVTADVDSLERDPPALLPAGPPSPAAAGEERCIAVVEEALAAAADTRREPASGGETTTSSPCDVRDPAELAVALAESTCVARISACFRETNALCGELTAASFVGRRPALRGGALAKLRPVAI